MFHRFAHHPLCSEYEREVIRIGRRGRICKGCSLLALGLFAGAAAGVFLRMPLAIAAPIALVGALMAAGSLRFRLGKIASRLFPASIAGLVSANAILARSPSDLAMIGLVFAAVAVLYVGYRRRGPDRRACEACPERSIASSCRGMGEILRRERAFRRLSARLVDQSLVVQ